MSVDIRTRTDDDPATPFPPDAALRAWLWFLGEAKGRYCRVKEQVEQAAEAVRAAVVQDFRGLLPEVLAATAKHQGLLDAWTVVAVLDATRNEVPERMMNTIREARAALLDLNESAGGDPTADIIGLGLTRARVGGRLEGIKRVSALLNKVESKIQALTPPPF